MKESIRNNLENTRDRFEEVAGLLADPEIISNANRFRDLSREYARLEPVIGLFRQFELLERDIEAAGEMCRDADAEIRQMGEDELATLQERRESLVTELQKSLIPRDPHDDSNVYLEIRAGTGGDEAALFAGDLFRMYCTLRREQRDWAAGDPE
ncbi:MAG: PCRF domain-containing protein [Woeseiaceae bacterium]|nr:PCRF domain-containing protein [Woeseiaceae bacterium]